MRLYKNARIWDEEVKRIKEGREDPVGFFGRLRHIMDMPDKPHFSCCDNKPYPQRYTLMFYTGMKDSKGTEICDKDWVLLSIPECNEQVKCEVFYEEDTACFSVRVLEDNTVTYPLFGMGQYIQVIGNKFEGLIDFKNGNN